ncbi:TPM domain-containing protein [Chromohalobacter canadensis]|uniref:TPM domain-containing protein n=1 Tax=Chromohalobacter canadensis TaxID=141389 RepID=A0ABZ0Y8F5_9GAMM|nr:TPM domain-containing protein [Chromohalobacter canadensis]MCK0769786.1 TPM domain-containing protein [Chromohalobacter canadensis]WQH08094.1 TPM domain-containing protein [Chromohalobacter canadensis]
MRHCIRLTCLMLLWACALSVQAQDIEFPELTGRVVDQADLLDASTRDELSGMLAAHEEDTGEQVVVVTLPDLQGAPIEEYGYQLGRHWGIGQEDEDNGALLIVSMEEQAIRIEVGYGLEGRLTDAQSSAIITQKIAPAFREGDYATGITQGTEAIIQVLGGDPMADAPPAGSASGHDKSRDVGGASVAFFVMLMIVMGIVRGIGGGGRGGRRRGRGGGLLGGLLLGGAMGGGFGGGGGGLGGGGFGGGGGGFGGGGASGGW